MAPSLLTAALLAAACWTGVGQAETSGGLRVLATLPWATGQEYDAVAPSQTLVRDSDDMRGRVLAVVAWSGAATHQYRSGIPSDN